MKRFTALFLLGLSLMFYPASGQDTNISNGLIFDGEPFLSVNPADPHHFVVAWMGFSLGNNIVIKTSVSTDAGANWSSPTGLPHTQSGHTAADPSLRWDHQGNVYLCLIDYDASTFQTGAIQVHKSTNGGMTWGGPAEVISVTDCPGKYCIDRPWMVIDTTPGPNQGNIYVTSMNGKPALGNPPYNPYIARSTNGGSSFETPRFLDTLNWLAGSVVNQPMPTPSVAANGTLYAIYPSYVPGQNLFPQNILATSTNGGIGFTHSTSYVLNSAGANDSLAKKGPLLITNPADPNHLAYFAIRGTSGDLDVLMQESMDGGQSWSNVIRVNDDPLGNGVMQDMVWADFDTDGDLAVAWRDRRTAGGTGYAQTTETWVAVRWKDSTDFSPNVQLSAASANFDPVLNEAGNDFMGIEFVDDTVSAAWGDVSSGTLSIWFTRMALRSGMTSTWPIVSEPMPKEIAYPNPTSGLLELKRIKTPFAYTIVDLAGRIVQQSEKNFSPTLDISPLKPGLYFLQWQANERQGVLRILKE